MKIKFYGKKKFVSGFTLIEIIIVVSVLAILTGMVISVINPQKYQGKTRDARRKVDLANIQSVLEIYFETNRQYPIMTVNSSESGWATLLDSGYISKMPVDPKNDDVYYYYYIGTTTDYELNAILEEDSASSSDDGGNNSGRYEVGSDLTLIP